MPILDSSFRIAKKHGIIPVNENDATEFVNKFNTNADLIRCVYRKMEKTKLLPELHEMKRRKDADLANQYRIKGDHLKDAKKYMAALQAYNQSLCLAPLQSEALALSYAARSVVYSEMGFYSFALENIVLAKEIRRPVKRLPEWKIMERKLIKKIKKLKRTEICGAIGILELSHPENHQIPSIIAGLECANSNVYGRHIVTQRNLSPGDIVALEKPFITAQFNNFEYISCSNCLSHHFFNLIPCPNSRRAMFCSSDCFDIAWRRYYKYECPIIDGLYSWVGSLFAVRATFKALTAFKDPDEMMQLINPDSVNPFECDFRNIDERTKIRLFNSMSTNQERRTNLDILRIVYICATVFCMVKHYSKFGELFENKEFETLFLELLMRYRQIEEVNNFSIIAPFKRSKSEVNHFSNKAMAHGNYLVSYLFAHSCAPNVGVFPSDDEGGIGFVVLRPIKRGEPLFITYGDTFITSSKASRQEELKEIYQFDCNCEACADETIFTREVVSKLVVPADLVDLIYKLSPRVCTFNNETQALARNVRQQISQFLSNNDAEHYPCRHLYYLEEILLEAICICVFIKPIDLLFEKDSLYKKVVRKLSQIQYALSPASVRFTLSMK